MYYYDTIAAISTPPGAGGISIVRLSGEDAIKIVDTIFNRIKGKKLKDVKTHTINYGHIIDFYKKDHIIDEVLVSVMRQPNTYTKENIVEINCHGGVVATRLVLEQVLKAGGRLAEEGEFTKRAFLNGRIDLVQAEAIMDIINSKTDISLGVAVEQLEGSLSKKISNIRKRLLSLAAHLQAAVDFPEDEIEEISNENILSNFKDINKDVNDLIETSDTGKIIREGLSTVIIGKPNVGKSSLLNALIKEERAIVTEVAGTTRDTIEEFINIKGIPLKIIDTAGIRETEDVVEKIGVERSKKLIETADLIIIILDGSQRLTNIDKDIIKLVLNKKVIVLINKVDLQTNIEYEYINDILKDYPVINISAKEGIGMNTLENTIKEMFFSGKAIINENDMIITNMRHKQSLIKAQQDINNSIKTIKLRMPIDMVSIDINSAISNLGEVIGLTVSEEIIDEVFQRFCLGK